MEGTNDIGKVAVTLLKEQEAAFTTKLRRTPVAIVNRHNVVLPYWQEYVRDAELIHIDYHDDMLDNVPVEQDGKITSHENLRIDNFICAGVSEGLVYSVNWFNPYRPDKVCVWGTKEDNLKTKIDENKNKIKWENKIFKLTEFVEPSQISLNGNQFILDIDLDGFYCGNFSFGNCRDRIRNTKKFLKSLRRKPDIITIALSSPEYLPKHKTVRILTATYDMLKQVYRN